MTLHRSNFTAFINRFIDTCAFACHVQTHLDTKSHLRLCKHTLLIFLYKSFIRNVSADFFFNQNHLSLRKLSALQELHLLVCICSWTSLPVLKLYEKVSDWQGISAFHMLTLKASCRKSNSSKSLNISEQASRTKMIYAFWHVDRC